ncbi:hypothetical protein A5630_11715 [Mycolicibacterium mucogenicum]|uniref:Uncharacterized protein n=1 Tax=Mycolicibacterium mucogenicum TaxID=56689 RepID=A0A1A3HFK2_MYCMU|nr:hypothetical protein A5630_11715 [Mycolicibacterium mucogenicum]
MFAVAAELHERYIHGSSGIWAIPGWRINGARIDEFEVDDTFWESGSDRSAAEDKHRALRSPSLIDTFGIAHDSVHAAQHSFAKCLSVGAHHYRDGPNPVERSCCCQRARTSRHEHPDAVAAVYADVEKAKCDRVQPDLAFLPSHRPTLVQELDTLRVFGGLLVECPAERYAGIGANLLQAHEVR